MISKDHLGLPMTTGHGETTARYREALAALHRYSLDPLSAIEAALADDPEFVMGHAFKALAFIMSSEKRALGMAREAIDAGERLVARGLGTDRERAHLEAARTWVDGNFQGGLDRYGRLLADYPRDALALQGTHAGNFFLGRATGLRDQIAGALPHYSAQDDVYSYALGMLAFGYEECREYSRAEHAASRALALNPVDPWAVHAWAHTHEMQGLETHGIRLYQEHPEAFADNALAVHNYWHLALFQLEAGERAKALELYDSRIYPGSSEVMLELADASSFLWRLQLTGEDVSERFAKVADVFRGLDDTDHYAFNDAHAVMAYAGAGQEADVTRLVAGLERTSQGSGTNAALARDVGLPVARGFAAFARGDYQRSIDQLYRVRYVSNAFGGSNAQRDVIEWTLVEAALRSGELGLARAVIEARLLQKPMNGFEQKQMARLFNQLRANLAAE
jgi:tetratricopeptide (TPR) repeat protein